MFGGESKRKSKKSFGGVGPVNVHHVHFLHSTNIGGQAGQGQQQHRGRRQRHISEHNMKWFGSKLNDGGPQLLSLSPLRLDEDDTVFFPPSSAPSTPSEVKRRTRGRSISPWLRRKLRQDSIDEEVMVDDNFSLCSVDKRGGIIDDKKNRHMSYSGRIRCWSPTRNNSVGGVYPGGNTIGLGPSPRRTPLSQLDRRNDVGSIPQTHPKLSYPQCFPSSPSCRDISSGNTTDFSVFRPHSQDRVGFPLKGRGLSEFQPKSYSYISSDEDNNTRLSLNTDHSSRTTSLLPETYDDVCDAVSMNQMEFSDPDHHFHRPGSRSLTDSLRRSHENSPCLKRIHRHHVNYALSSSSSQAPSSNHHYHPHSNRNEHNSNGEGQQQKIVNLPPLPKRTSTSSPTHKKSQNSYLTDSNSPTSYEQLKLKLKEVSDKCFNSGKLSSSRLFSKFYISKNDKLTEGIINNGSNSTSTGNVCRRTRMNGSDDVVDDGRKVRSFSFGGIPQDFSRDDYEKDEQQHCELRVNPLFVDDGNGMIVGHHENDSHHEGYDDITSSRTGGNRTGGGYKISHSRSSSSPNNCQLSLSVPRNLDFITSNSSAASYQSHSSQGSGSSGDSGIVNETLDLNDLSSTSCSNSNSCCLVRFHDGENGGSPSSFGSLRNANSTKNRGQQKKSSNSSYFGYKSRHHSSSSLKNDDQSSGNFIAPNTSRTHRQHYHPENGSKSMRGNNKSMQDLNFQNEQFLNSNENTLRQPSGGEYRLIRIRKLAPFMKRSVVPDEMNRELGITLEKNPTEANGYILTFLHPDSSIASQEELQLEDEIISINGKFVRGLNLSEVYSLMLSGLKRELDLVILRHSTMTTPPPPLPTSPAPHCVLQESQNKTIIKISYDDEQEVDSSPRNNNNGNNAGGDHSSNKSSLRKSKGTRVAFEDNNSSRSDINSARRKFVNSLMESSSNTASLDLESSNSGISDRKAKDDSPSFCTLPRRPKSSPTTTTIVFEKGAGKKPLGFTVVGGKDSPKGDIPIFIKTVLSNGQAEGRLQEGDEVLAINGELMEGLTHNEAVNCFKKVKHGSIVLKIIRRTKRKSSSLKSQSCDNLIDA